MPLDKPVTAPSRVFRIAKWLLLATIAYNVAEGIVAIWSGVVAGSIALVAFGADSYLEVAAAGIVLWRLNSTGSDAGEQLERRAEAFVGWSFLALGAAVVFQSGWSIWNGAGAEESQVGIGLVIASVVVMPGLSLWKLRTAARLNLRSLAAEAKETIACTYLSVVLLIGLAANAVLGWWWLDSLTALLLVPWLIKEGLEAIRGEEEEEESELRLCACRSCFYGLRKRAHASQGPFD